MLMPWPLAGYRSLRIKSWYSKRELSEDHFGHETLLADTMGWWPGVGGKLSWRYWTSGFCAQLRIISPIIRGVINRQFLSRAL